MIFLGLEKVFTCNPWLAILWWNMMISHWIKRGMGPYSRTNPNGEMNGSGQILIHPLKWKMDGSDDWIRWTDCRPTQVFCFCMGSKIRNWIWAFLSPRKSESRELTFGACSQLGDPMWMANISTWRFPRIGVPPNHHKSSIFLVDFSTINHLFLDSRICGHPKRFLQIPFCLVPGQTRPSQG